jgi:hypothetical protein
VNNVKFLVVFSFKSEHAKAIRERFKTWTPPAEIKFIFPVHTILGANKSVSIIEAITEADLAKLIGVWTDLGSYKINPIMESREAVKLV